MEKNNKLERGYKFGDFKEIFLNTKINSIILRRANISYADGSEDFQFKKLKYMDFKGRMNSLGEQFKGIKQCYFQRTGVELEIACSTAESIIDAYQNDFKIYLWRPNLPDEEDNHILELAVAGNAQAIITHNLKDFRQGQLAFPQIAILTPKQFITEDQHVYTHYQIA